jgi:hypothetical protein
MTPGKVNFVCPQGSTFSRTLTYKVDDDPVDLTGYSARLQVREYHYSDDFIASLTDSSGITLGGSAGTISILVAASATQSFVAGDYVYDLELVAGGTVTRLIEGKFTVTPEVTR